MTETRIQVQAVLFAAIMLVSMIAVGVGGLGSAAAQNGPTPAETIEVATAEELVDAAAGEPVNGETIRKGGEIVLTTTSAAYSLDQSLRVEVSNVTLRNSTGATEKPVISYTAPAPSSEKTIRVNADGVKLKNLEVKRIAAGDRKTGAQPFAHGIVIRSRSGDEITDVTVENVDITGDGFKDKYNRGLQVLDGTGSQSADASRITVTDSSVAGFDGGLSIGASYGGSISGVSFTNNEIIGHNGETASTVGIDVSTADLDGNAAGTVSDLTITGNEFNEFEEEGQSVVTEIAADDGTIGVIDFGTVLEENTLEGAVAFSDSNSARTYTDDSQPGYKFASITPDVEDAEEIAKEGDRVELAEGTYENTELTITTPSLTLTSAGEMDQTELRFSPNEETDSATGSATIDISASDVTVSDLTVYRGPNFDRLKDDPHAQGVVVREPGVTLRNLDVNSDYGAIGDNEFNRFDGVVILDTGGNDDNVQLTDVDVSLFHAGIVVSNYAADGGVDGVSIDGGQVDENVDGVVVKSHQDSEGVSNVSVTDLRAVNNKNAGVLIPGDTYQGYSLEPLNASRVNVTGNDITSNDVDAVNNGTNTLNATENWWGSADGPTQDNTTGDVTVSPWLDASITNNGEPVTLPIKNLQTEESFTSIQAAIDAADSGQAIGIAGGTYEEPIVIDKQGLTLTPRSIDEPPTIKNDGSASATVRIDADDVSLYGLNIQNAAGDSFDQGIRATGTGVTIADNTISANAGSSAVAVFDDRGGLPTGGTPVPTDVTIQDNTIQDAAIGVNVLSTTSQETTATIQDNTIEDMTSADGSEKPGIGVAIAKLDAADGETGPTDPTVTVTSSEGRTQTINTSTIGLRVYGDETQNGIKFGEIGKSQITIEDTEFNTNTPESARYVVDATSNLLDLELILENNSFDPVAAVDGAQVIPDSQVVQNPRVNVSASSVVPSAVTTGEENSYEATIKLEDLRDVTEGRVTVSLIDYPTPSEDGNLTSTVAGADLSGDTATVTVAGDDFNGVEAPAVGTYDAEVTVENFDGEVSSIKNQSIGEITVSEADLGIKHTESSGGSTGITTDDGQIAFTEVLSASPQNRETMKFGSGVDRAIEIRHPETGDRIQIEPQADEGTYNVDRVRLDVYNGAGKLDEQDTADSPDIGLTVVNGDERSTERINVTIEGDTDIFTSRENTFSEFELALVENGAVVDTSSQRLIGVGYRASFEQDGTEDEITVAIPRNEEVDESWDVNFRLGGFEDGVETDVKNVAGADEFEATVDVSELEPGQYDARFEIYKSEETPLGDRIINVFGVDEVVIEPTDVADPDISIEHNPGSATASTPTEDGRVYADQLDIFVNTDDPVAFGGQGDLQLRVVDPDTGDAVTYTPTSTARTVPLDEMYRLGIQNDGTGEPQEEILPFPKPSSDLSFENIDATVEGNTSIYTNETFNEYVIELVNDDGKVINSTDTRLVGMGYEASFEQDGGTAFVTRDPAVDPNWTAEFALVEDNSSIPPSEQVIDTVEVDHTEGDEHFEIPLGELDADPGEYSWTLTIVDESRAELDRERIVRISGDQELDTGVTIRDSFDQPDTQPQVTLQPPRPASQTAPTAFNISVEQQEPETVALEVLDSEENVVFEKSVDNAFENGTFATWDSTNQAGNVLPDGEYDVVVTVEIETGTESTANKTVTVDNTAPTIENLKLVEPVDGETNNQITLRGDISDTGTDVQLAQAAIIAESTPYTVTEEFEGTEAVQTALEDGTLEVTFDATAISDEVGDGEFRIGMRAVDEAGNAALVEGDSFTIDTSAPSVQPGVSELANATATLTVEAEEDVTITNLAIQAVSSESESTADRTPESYDTDITPDEPATIEFDGGTVNNEDTTFTIDIKTEDGAGNTVTNTLTSSISSYQIEADGTAEVDPSAVDSSFALKTNVESGGDTKREATVAQSTSAPSGTTLADDQVARKFIDVTDIGLSEAELTEADVKIPLSEVDIEGVDDDELTMLYSPDGESEYETIDSEIVEEDGQEYLVASVDGFSQLAPAVVDDEAPMIDSPSITPGTNIDLADSSDSATVTFDYADAISEINTTATSVDVSGVDSDRVNAQVTKSTATVDVTGLEDGDSINVEITVVDDAGNEDSENARIFVDDSTTEREGNTGGSGGSIGGDTSGDTSDIDDTDDADSTDVINDTDSTDGNSTDGSTNDSMSGSTEDDSSDNETTDDTSSDNGTSDGEMSDDEATDDSTPGFGAIVALVALIIAAFIATRREE